MSRALILGLLALLASCGKSAPPPQQAMPVTVAQPLVRNIEEWDDYTGRFQAIEDTAVRSRVSGYVQSVNFREGETVARGALLFVIDPRPFEVALQSARAQLQDAEAQLRFATTDLARAQELIKNQTVPARVLDQRRQAKDLAEAGIARARAAVREAELNLSYTRITAPISGRTSAKNVSIGDFIAGGTAQGAPLTTIVSLNPIHFVFDADEAAYLKYVRLAAEGTRPSSRDTANPVQLQLIGEQGYPHMGRMDLVDNRIDPSTGTMRGRAVFNNPRNVFIPGMFGRLRLLGSGHYDAIMVPDDAIGSDQTEKVVFIVGKDNNVTPRPVKLGPVVDGLRVIRSGLAANETIVINGLVRLRPGMPISPQPGKITAQAGAGQ